MSPAASATVAQHHVILAELARATRAGHPDADWHEVEPLMREVWESATRGASWEQIRPQAATHWRSGDQYPCPAVVLSPSMSAVEECVRAHDSGASAFELGSALPRQAPRHEETP